MNISLNATTKLHIVRLYIICTFIPYCWPFAKLTVIKRTSIKIEIFFEVNCRPVVIVAVYMRVREKSITQCVNNGFSLQLILRFTVYFVYFILYIRVTKPHKLQ